MKKYFSLLTFFFLILYFVSCQGPIGPIGPIGSTGPIGPTGPTGPSGEDSIVKIIFVSSDLYARDIAFNSNTIVCVGDYSSIYVSTDGKVWNSSSIKVTIGYTLYGIAYGEGVFVAVGDGGIIFRSTDGGNNWEQVSSPTNIPFYDIAYGNGTFVLVGNDGEVGVIYRSTDLGLTWQEPSYYGNVYSSINYANGIFFAGTNHGDISTSTDWNVWSESINPIGSYLYKIINVSYGNGVYIVADSYGNLASSFDGINWQSIYPSWQISCYGFCFAENWFALLTESMILCPYDESTWLFPYTELPGLVEQIYNGIYWIPWLNDGTFLITIFYN